MPVAKLDNAPRCQHTKMNGQPCSAPARRHRKYCVFHEAAHAKRPDQSIRLVEDAMSLQFALMQVMRSLDDHSIDPKRAALKLYALQIAASNLKRLQQEIDYVPAEDPARQKSLLELLLDNLQVPEEERERARAGMPAAAPSFTPDDLNPASSATFTIRACLSDEPPNRQLPATGHRFADLPPSAFIGGHKESHTQGPATSEAWLQPGRGAWVKCEVLKKAQRVKSPSGLRFLQPDYFSTTEILGSLP